MPTCFVIQPFDSGKFDKRFDGVFKPAIESANLEAYRVDRDPKVEVPIDAIEEGIRNAAICFADISTDNPNVWYELGFAFASGRPVVMVCSDERIGHKFPFDIQHRTIINYKAEAPQDFEALASAITNRIEALLTKKEALRQIAETEQIATTHGLSQPELIVLANLAGETGPAGSSQGIYALKSDSERSGLTSIGFSLAFRRLKAKAFVEIEEVHDGGDPYEAARLTDRGWSWIESNESLFVLKKPTRKKVDDFDDDIPF